MHAGLSPLLPKGVGKNPSDFEFFLTIMSLCSEFRLGTRQSLGGGEKKGPKFSENDVLNSR